MPRAIDHVLLIALSSSGLVACGPKAGNKACSADGACGSGSGSSGGTTTTTTGAGPTTAPGSSTSTSGSTTGTTGGTTTTGTTGGGTTTGTPGCWGTGSGCTSELDVLVVVDNSGSMGQEQVNVARNLAKFVGRLEGLMDAEGKPIGPDVQIMVTTTDVGNPLCTPFQPPGYSPAVGSPVATACTTRLQDFTGLGSNPLAVPEACTGVCQNDMAAPEGDPFIAFGPGGDNIPDTVTPTDIDGDGIADSPAAQALACVAPQGINGCGYQSPLEAMLQALNPTAAWNTGARPFLRDGAVLAIVLVTDGIDCSVKDYSLMTDQTYMNVNPSTGSKAASGAICWNAGVSCNGPDGNGMYTNCMASGLAQMQPENRYTGYLVDTLQQQQGKEVHMLGVVGVPPVTQHDPNPPHEPTMGGVLDLAYRDWQSGEYPTGDILPDDFQSGVTAAEQQFVFGIGPGCTGVDPMGNVLGQASPPVRVKEVCEALNFTDSNGNEQVRCCLESICDSDFTAVLDCLTPGP